MVRTPSTMLPLGTRLPSFALSAIDGSVASPDRFHDNPGLLVAFICTHCPFVKHIRHEFARFTREYAEKGLGIVGIMSNDVNAFPEDGPEGMAQEARAVGYEFPYAFDETQE